MANDDAARESEATRPSPPPTSRRPRPTTPRATPSSSSTWSSSSSEASSRRLLPAKYAHMTPEELDVRLRLLRATVGTRR